MKHNSALPSSAADEVVQLQWRDPRAVSEACFLMVQDEAELVLLRLARLTVSLLSC